MSAVGVFVGRSKLVHSPCGVICVMWFVAAFLDEWPLEFRVVRFFVLVVAYGSRLGNYLMSDMVATPSEIKLLKSSVGEGFGILNRLRAQVPNAS